MQGDPVKVSHGSRLSPREDTASSTHRPRPICLRKLERADEAFEELLSFPDLPPADQELAQRRFDALRRLVGVVAI
ncbi:hypothetical protein [Sorangium sp. So ce406]|uniref:hypothetical protein n=1 Tax=Sorangium sp. So ce406 TaxID=3133311 RepID=UPI003F5CB368